MIEQNGPLSNVNAISRADRKDKDTSVSRIPRDPENPQKFQSMVVQEKEKKDNRESIKEEEPEASVSIFDLSSQKNQKPRPVNVTQTSKEAEAMRGAHFIAKNQDTKQAIDADSEEDPSVSDDDADIEGSSKKGKHDDLGSKLIGDASLDKKDSGAHSHSDSKSSAAEESTRRRDESVARTELPVQPIVGSASAASSSHAFVSSQTQPAIESVAPSSPTPPPVSSGKDLQLIIEKVVETMTLLQANNQTDLAVTLRYPPILEGAQLVVSSFGSATGEFNIAFYNLTQSSQQFLEQMQARAGIKQALEEKGYIMHMFITTAQPYAPIVATDAENRADQRRFHDEEGQQQGNKKSRQDT